MDNSLAAQVVEEFRKVVWVFTFGDREGQGEVTQVVFLQSILSSGQSFPSGPQEKLFANDCKTIWKPT